MTNSTTPQGEPISLPAPWDYAYEWDSPLGIRRSFDYRSHNGVKPDRHVALFTDEQMMAAIKQDRANRAASPDVARTDTERLDWIERKVCDVSRLGDSARTVRIAWNNGADHVDIGPHCYANWREAIDAAIDSLGAAATQARAAVPETPEAAGLKSDDPDTDLSAYERWHGI